MKDDVFRALCLQTGRSATALGCNSRIAFELGVSPCDSKTGDLKHLLNFAHLAMLLLNRRHLIRRPKLHLESRWSNGDFNLSASS
jgi:hypothetical protein